MKKIISLLLTIAIMLTFFLSDGKNYMGVAAVDAVKNEMRGVWVATTYAIDFPKTKNMSAQKAELDKIVNNTAKAGLNTIFFQVRPQGDALYKSAIFPWNEYLTGTVGKNPGYDPLEYLIAAAKKQNIAVHAWINPYRLTRGSPSSPQNAIGDLPDGHPAKSNPAIAVAFDDGQLYLNPGEPQAQQLVLDGVEELVRNYDIAGIHFDDYFYPNANVTKDGKTYKATFNDGTSYKKYGTGQSLAQWRRDNTYKLIKDTRDLVKSINPQLAFGVSPSGIWETSKANPANGANVGAGSFASYSAIYADSRKWVKDEIVDYICPQLYWKIGTKNSDYEILVKWWSDVCKGTNVKLYIGQAAYRVDAWKESDEIITQLKMNEGYSNIWGSVFYGYSNIANNVLDLSNKLKTYYERAEKPVQPPIQPPNPPLIPANDRIVPAVSDLIISSPSNNSSTYSKTSYIIGAGVAGVPVYVNGEEIKRSENGYFALFYDLEAGENVFDFEHNGKTAKYVITRKTSSGGGSSGGQPPKVTDISDKGLVGMIKNNYTSVFDNYTSPMNRKTPLNKGFCDYLVSETNTYYKFRFGGWVSKTNVSVENISLPENVIGGMKTVRTDKTTIFKWKMPVPTMHTITEKVEGLEISFHNTAGIAPMQMASSNPLFTSVSFVQDKTNAVYTFASPKERYLFGYETRYKNGWFELEMNNPPKLAAGEKPLKGRTIHLDAGHGGSDIGAMGPLGKDGANESTLNMYVALELEKRLTDLGAKVIMPNKDLAKTTSQEERENSIRKSKADLAISIHHNSVDTSSNVGSVFGLETLYSQPLSRRLAETVQRNLIAATGAKDRGPKYQNLFMCRHPQMPTILIEMGFVSNPYEYENLTLTSYIQKEVDGIVNGVLEFLSY